MKGIVFNVLEEEISAAFGEAMWETLLVKAGTDGVFTSLGTYDDAVLGALVRAAASELSMDPACVVRWFGKRAIPNFRRRYPELFARHQGTRSFILALNHIIHPEVRKLYPGADVPDFEFRDEDDTLMMIYRSQRRLCALAEGMIEGAAEHFGEQWEVEQSACMLRGDPHCAFALRFKGPRRE